MEIGQGKKNWWRVKHVWLYSGSPRDYGEKLYRLWDFNRGGLNFYAHCTPLQVWNLEIHKIML